MIAQRPVVSSVSSVGKLRNVVKGSGGIDSVGIELYGEGFLGLANDAAKARDGQPYETFARFRAGVFP